jgi:hypothetical protein
MAGVRDVQETGERAQPADHHPPARTGLARAFPATPPPGPFRRSAWRSPMRGPWLTSIRESGLLFAASAVVFAIRLRQEER